MSKRTSSSKENSHEARKQLQKQEHKTLERLREAQEAQARALARFEKAQARLSKRTARLERVEDHLALIRQQLNVENATQHALPTVQEEAASSPIADEMSNASADAHVEAAETQPPADEMRAAAEATEESIRLSAERAASLPPISPAAPASEAAQEEHVAEFEIENIEDEPSTRLYPPAIEQIEEEEEMLQAITSETFAHFAAEHAAKARVAAEISYAQTREARQLARQAELALGAVRLAIRQGTLSGEEADFALRQAEREVTRAQAILADAEAAEEQTAQAASDAEAEAEVAEGMAFAASDHVALLEEARGFEDEADITMKIPIVHLRPEEPPTSV